MISFDAERLFDTALAKEGIRFEVPSWAIGVSVRQRLYKWRSQLQARQPSIPTPYDGIRLSLQTPLGQLATKDTPGPIHVVFLILEFQGRLLSLDGEEIEAVVEEDLPDEPPDISDLISGLSLELGEE